MKMILVIAALAVLLTGCSQAPTFETQGDAYTHQEPVPGTVQVALPTDAVMTVMQTDTEKMWLCDDFEVMVYTLPGGDLGATLRTLSGFDPARLTVLETQPDRYEWVWSAAGEGGDQVGRAVLVDRDGFHYCVVLMTAEANAGRLQDQWQAILDSMEIV